MKLENIGFYTLSDKRAEITTINSNIHRAEMILTDKCNFSCPYCQGLRDDIKGTMPLDKSLHVLNQWISNGLKNVRFSGGEPTLYKHLDQLIRTCQQNNVEKIAISTNGSQSVDYYKNLITLGVNDFSISLDAGCCSIGDKMSGNIKNSWTHTVNIIKELSKLTYVTVGMVFTEENIADSINAITFASNLGVSDIRIISSAQYNEGITDLEYLSDEILKKHPILNYRVQNFKNDKNVRGINTKCDTNKCPLVLDDVMVAGEYQFPCVIYMRQKGNPISKMINNLNWREDRYQWYLNHNTHEDEICLQNCLDVCVDFNNKRQSNF